MAAAARQDDQGTVIQAGEEGAEEEEGEYQDAERVKVQVIIGDEVPLILMILKTHLYGGAHGCHPLDPLPPNPMDLLGNQVDVLHDASLQAKPGLQVKVSSKPCIRHAQGGIMPDPDLNPDSDDDDMPRLKIPPPIFKGLPGERPDTHIYATEDWMEAMHFREDQYIDKFKHTLNHLA